MTNVETGAGWKKIVYKCKKYACPFSEMLITLFLGHCYIKCPFLGLGAYFGQFSSNGISFHHEHMFAMGFEF